MSPKTTSVEFTGSPAFTEFLKGIEKSNPKDIQIAKTWEDKDSARLGYDFGLLWHALVYVAEAYSVAHMTADISRYLTTSKEKELRAATPVREIIITVSPNMTRQEVEQQVKIKLDELFAET